MKNLQMTNIRNIVFRIKDLKEELEEACLRGAGLEGEKREKNQAYISKLINEILTSESVARELKEEYDKSKLKEKLDNAENVLEEENKEEAFGQEKLVKAFERRVEQIKTQYKGASLKEISDNQRRTILAGAKDKIGMDITQEFIQTIVKFNYEQANQVIKALNKTSFYNQRIRLTASVKTMKHNENYEKIVKEVKSNINKIEWFEANSDLLRAIDELLEPTDAQVRLIANVAKYIETASTLVDFGIDIQNYEHRVVRDGQEMLYYTINWDRFKADIKSKLNRESASNFLQTWGYLANQYAGQDLEQHERNHLRSLYMQLGEYELTRPSHLMTIFKNNYDKVVAELEHAVRLEKAINNSANSKFREEISKTTTKNIAKEVKQVKLTQDQEDARDLYSFVFNIYAVVGQEVPEEMRRILPDAYSQNRQEVYVGIAENHIQEFRRLVMEQRKVVKETYLQYSSNDSKHTFNWGAYIAEQPESVLRILGLADMM